MAKQLNQKRMLASRLAILSIIFIIIFSPQYWASTSGWNSVFETLGIVMIIICVLGRLYSSAFIGGFKNDTLVTSGIYSMLRNPLYFFTLTGITGIALLSRIPIIMIGLPLFFLWLYLRLIKREEKFLANEFGDDYQTYKKNTYALIPKFSDYHAPEIMQFKPKFLTNAFRDTLGWLLILPFIKLIEFLHINELIPFIITIL